MNAMCISKIWAHNLKKGTAGRIIKKKNFGGCFSVAHHASMFFLKIYYLC